MEKIIQTLSSSTARSTAIYYVGNFLLNIGRYFFHLILLRFLSPAEYGEFLSYLSLIYILAIPMGTIGNVVTKYVSEFKGKNDSISINHFFYYILNKAIPFTLILTFLPIIFATQLSSVFKAHSVAFVVLGVSVFISLFQTMLSSYLVAFQKFIFQTILGYLSVFLTIILSIIFIKIGLGATGAVMGQLVTGIILTVITFITISKSIYPEKFGRENFSIDLKSFTGYSLLYSIGTMSLISTDILIVRYLFDPHTSGLYSSLSILGRMIFYGLTPLTALALPIATHRYASQGSARSVFIKLGSVLLLFGFIGAGIFSLFPTFIIKILSGEQYITAVPYLSLFSFTMVFFALNQFVISYLMAIGKPKVNVLLLIAATIQPLAILVFKDSFSLVVWSNLIVQLLLFVSVAYFVINSQSLISTKSVKSG